MGRKRGFNKPYKIYKKKDRCIRVVFDDIPYKSFSSGTTDLAEAIEWADAFLERGGIARPKKTPSLAEYTNGFFLRDDAESVRQRDMRYGHEYSRSRYKKYQHYIDDYICREFGAYLVTAISSRSIERWLPSLQSSKGKPLANDTKNKILVAFRIVMDEVKKDGYRDDNPAKDVKMFAKKGKRREALPPQIIKALFPDDLEKRIEIWHGLMWATYFSVMYDTGFRPGEMAALRVCDIYQSRKGLSVGAVTTVNKDEGKIVERVKTSDDGYDKRPGLLYEDTAELVVRLIKEKNLSGEDRLFTAPNRKDGLLMSDTSNKHFKTVLTENGFYKEGRVQYSMRHSYMTARRGDMPDDILAISMGHTHLRDDYDHQTMTDLIRRLDEKRESFFENRTRLDEEPDIKRFKP